MQSKYIEPLSVAGGVVTGGTYRIVSGNAVRVSASLQRVAALLMMKRGSVPGSRFFTCGLRDLKHRGKTWAARVVALIDKALRPHQATPTAAGLYVSYERQAWVENNVGKFKVTIQTADGVGEVTVPLPLAA
jgi:hypothetical protein